MLRCPACANTGEFEFTQDGRWTVCTLCGTYCDPDKGKCMLSLDDEAAMRMPALRKALINAFEERYFSNCDQITTDMLELLPDDFQATFYKHLSMKTRGDSRAYEQFLNLMPIAPTPEEANEAYTRALELFEPREFESVSRFIESAFAPSERGERARGLIERNKRAMREFEDFAERPRDVFICYSSHDAPIAERVADEINNEGISVYLYTRNMPLNAPRYDERIKYAIENARVFLVITSVNSLYSGEVAKEIRIAQSAASLKRIELCVDDTPRTVLFKQFFEGITYINGAHLGAVTYELIKQRVRDEMQAASKPDRARDADAAKPQNANEERLRARFKHLPAATLDAIIIRVYRGDIDWLEAALELSKPASAPIKPQMAEQDAEKVYQSAQNAQAGEKLKLMITAATLGHPAAQYKLGYVYYSGENVALNYKQALIWFERVAAQGSADAMYAIGCIHYMGKGVPKDGHKAFYWFERAAALDHADAQYFLGVMYRDGKGGEKRAAMAEIMFGKAAAQGHTAAQEALERIRAKPKK